MKKYKRPFSFSDDQKIEAYKLTKSFNDKLWKE